MKNLIMRKGQLLRRFGKQIRSKALRIAMQKWLMIGKARKLIIKPNNKPTKLPWNTNSKMPPRRKTSRSCKITEQLIRLPLTSTKALVSRAVTVTTPSEKSKTQCRGWMAGDRN